jgi:hypothetical protein
MEMKSDVVLNWISYKIFVIIIKTEGLKNPKNQTQNQIEGSTNFLLKNKIKNRGCVCV